MICDGCKRDLECEHVSFLGKEYDLCSFDVLELQRFQDQRASGDCININWGGGKLAPGCWDDIRSILRTYGIHEVLEMGSGLSSELFCIEGVDLVSFDVLDFHIRMLAACSTMKGRAKFHAYEYGQIPPVEEFYPGKRWDFVFVDGPQERSREVRLAMKLSNKLIYLHDPNAGEQSFFPDGDWEQLSIKLFKKRGT